MSLISITMGKTRNFYPGLNLLRGYSWGSTTPEWIDCSGLAPNAVMLGISADLFRATLNKVLGDDAAVLIRLPDPANGWQPLASDFAKLCQHAGVAAYNGVVGPITRSDEFGGFGHVCVPILDPGHIGFYALMEGGTLASAGCACGIGLNWYDTP